MASLVLVASPVSAGTLELSTEAIPDTSDGKLVPTAGMSILDIAVASDGTTIYAAMGTGGAAAGQKLYKSTDGGFTWQAITTPNNAAADAVNLVAVAPDDPDIIAVLGDISPATGNTAGYVSTDGGATFDNLNIPGGTWYDVTISPASDGIRYIGISGSIAGPAPVSSTSTWVRRHRTGRMPSAGRGVVSPRQPRLSARRLSRRTSLPT